MKVFIEAIEDSLVPAYVHDGDAGMDVRAAEDVEIAPGETKVVSIGIKMAMPKGIMCDVRPRSGLSLNTPLRVANAPGTVDSGYRNTVGVIITNISPKHEYVEDWEGMSLRNDQKYSISEKGNKHGTYVIKKGDRIAQLVFIKYETPELEICQDVSEIGEDRGGGFGHSGIK